VETDPTKVELPMAATDAFGNRIGMVFEELSGERVVGTIPVEGNTQPYGILHGGAACSLIESLASMGAALAAGFPERIVMGMQQSTNFIRAVRDGTVRGVATPLQTGRTTHVWQVDLTHVESGKLVASGRVTLAVREARPDQQG
jgi:1,4-dihydroxy-2-naphthoyl-CoA hydrolase